MASRRWSRARGAPTRGRRSGALAQLPDEPRFDALANMLVAETSFSAAPNEMAQIVFIAVNRANRWGVPVYQSRCRSATESGDQPLERQRALQARSTTALGARTKPVGSRPEPSSKRFWDGSYRNLGFTGFVHPGGMPVPPCAKVNSRCDLDRRRYPLYPRLGRQWQNGWQGSFRVIASGFRAEKPLKEIEIYGQA